MPNDTMARSALRQTVREKCSKAPARLPPGRMNRRSGGSSASSRSIAVFEPRNVGARHGDFRSVRDFPSRIGQASPNREEVFLKLLEQVGQGLRPAPPGLSPFQGRRSARQRRHRPPLWDPISTHARHRRARSGPGHPFACKSSWPPVYVRRPARREAPRAARGTGAAGIPPQAARLVRPPWPDAPMARDVGSLPHSGIRNHAAADAGRSRAAEISRVARQVPVVRSAGGGAGKGSHRARGIRSATTSAQSGCRRSRAKRSRTTAESCRRTSRRCCRSRASANTPPAPSAASPSASARRFSIPTWRACCSASSSAAGTRRRTRPNVSSGAFPHRSCLRADHLISIRR